MRSRSHPSNLVPGLDRRLPASPAPREQLLAALGVEEDGGVKEA
ncbi:MULTISPECIES: hypothetical protein [unclassified Streptomyces]|nr:MULTISPECIES: hypothetical protein [unclassified Streptomyces]